MGQTPEFPQIAGQRGLATIGQILESGWTLSATRQARATIWQEPMPRVVAPHRGQLDNPTTVTAQFLWAGPGAVLTGMTALIYLGVTERGYARTTFVVPAKGRAKSRGPVKVVRSWRPAESGRSAGVVPVASAARALVDAAVYEGVSRTRLEAITIQVLQQGLATPHDLELELYTRPQAKVEGVWQGLKAFTEGAWSLPEKALRQVVDGDGGFPRMLTNVTLETLDGEMVGCPDGFLEDASTVIQVHSRQFHQGIDDRGGDRWATTVEKDGAYTAAGLLVAAVSPWTLYQQPKRFLDALRRIVDRGLELPAAPVRVRTMPS